MSDFDGEDMMPLEPDPEDRPRVTYRRRRDMVVHESLTIWINGAHVGRLTVRSDAVSGETALLDWLESALEAHGAEESE